MAARRILGAKPDAAVHHCFQCKKRLAAIFDIDQIVIPSVSANGHVGHETLPGYTGKSGEG